MQRRKQITTLDIIQYLIMAALLVFMILMLTAGKSKVVPMETIASRMEALSTVGELEKKDQNDASKTFSADVSLFRESIYYSVDDIMNVNELLIARVEEEDSREMLLDALEAYRKEKADAFDGYGTNQFGLLNSAVITEKGDYVFFGVSEDVLQWETEFLKVVG